MTTTPAPLPLPAALVVGELQPLHDALRPLVATGASLDAAGVERADTAGVQLLTAFVRDVERHGRAVTWIGPSAALRDRAASLGLTGVLGLEREPT